MKLIESACRIIWVALLLVSAAEPARAELPTVAVITTGGTIAEKIDPATGGAVPALSGKDLLENVNADVYKAVQYALEKGVAVVVTTRVYHGGVFPIYGDQGGGETLQKAGVILGGYLTGPKARILLMITLPQVNGDHARLSEYFQY